MNGIFTAAIPVDHVRETPHIAESDRVANAGQGELERIGPVAAIRVRRRRRHDDQRRFVNRSAGQTRCLHDRRIARPRMDGLNKQKKIECE